MVMNVRSRVIYGRCVVRIVATLVPSRMMAVVMMLIVVAGPFAMLAFTAFPFATLGFMALMLPRLSLRVLVIFVAQFAHIAMPVAVLVMVVRRRTR